MMITCRPYLAKKLRHPSPAAAASRALSEVEGGGERKTSSFRGGGSSRVEGPRGFHREPPQRIKPASGQTGPPSGREQELAARGIFASRPASPSTSTRQNFSGKRLFREPSLRMTELFLPKNVCKRSSSMIRSTSCPQLIRIPLRLLAATLHAIRRHTTSSRNIPRTPLPPPKIPFSR
jgi:hypothetical protein